jgi:hypothetical protein
MAPEGAIPTPTPCRDETLVKALVGAQRWRRKIENGRVNSITDLAESQPAGRAPHALTSRCVAAFRA